MYRLPTCFSACGNVSNMEVGDAQLSRFSTAESQFTDVKCSSSAHVDDSPLQALSDDADDSPLQGLSDDADDSLLQALSDDADDSLLQALSDDASWVVWDQPDGVSPAQLVPCLNHRFF